ncbi:alpha-amylase family glycosyl hydrolase [Mucilaginibacter gotjawali]|uniref:Glycosidase n=2 Tax=Mucilaginibacter gotjawali TaxID=1550579 RepID=A0A839SDA0_9SPHI|nr:alpha-amylase family glycosyl hydrolase [Mucilaginibacter gotjawali]MBB3056181.1 glycosidase [Mucilaginibacter gotjawali]BAU53477.1 Alpha-amylase precursor [Mucilaginibacter gotjawali]
MRTAIPLPVILFLSLCFSTTIAGTIPKAKAADQGREEIIYHIFQRSFYDSNGDLQGDLTGIRQKLDYLQSLGVTAVLLTPLYESVFYHNYFASDFKKIDPAYGTMHDYLLLIKDLHRRGMKFYMDMETQYVTEDHIWWKDGVNNLKSPFSDYILYDDKAHSTPSSIVFNLKGLLGYDSVYRKITTVNLYSPKVLAYNYRLFRFWVDPNGDGKFDDGVDGFRLDHMMDNLDNKLPGLFARFWRPLLSKLRIVNPKLKIIAEQANWGSIGTDYFANGGVDRVFAFRLAFAIRTFKKDQIAAAADSTFMLTPANKQQVVFIENHDTPRFSYGVNGDTGHLKIGAALNLLLGGIPSIYYGQELGMSGTNAALGATDANDIPNRSAFEWYKSDRGTGMAVWYKEKGPWRNRFNNEVADDGISLEEQQNDSNSLWNCYRKMIAIRKANPVISNGAYKTLKSDKDDVFTFMRYEGNKKVVVAVNLSDKPETVTIAGEGKTGMLKVLYGAAKPGMVNNNITLTLPVYGIEVIGM